MFDVEGFVERCRASLGEANPVRAVREVVQRAVADPTAGAVFTPERADFGVLHRSDDLTVLHIALPPHMGAPPHDHTMWAVIGILDGQEDNAFFRAGEPALVPSGGREVHERETLAMGDDVIHAIRNPRSSYLSALHVYGGDLIAADRRQWDLEGRTVRRYDHDAFTSVFGSVRAEEDRLGRGLRGEELDAFLDRLAGAR